MAEPLYVSFLWHMHQPFYKDPVQGEYILPWTYLHAIKDYYDMPAIVDASPGAKVTFNLVPSLLEQIQDYAAGTAVDPFLTRARMAPADMTEEERLFVLDNFFSANRQRMVEPHQRYLELYCLAGDGVGGGSRDRLRVMGDQEILDLQVWFYLTWTGEAARRRFPEFRELVRKGKNFTASDKMLLFETQRVLIGEIIPLYKRLQEEGKVELSVTPYFHPILPLLCDSRLAQVAIPRVTLPTQHFRHPEDARSQLDRGISCFERLFGTAPKGVWPSEGAVSDEVLGILAERGITWTATDEWVLAKSLPRGLGRDREALYRPYDCQQGERETSIFFRDHVLSDLIGFTYSQWEADRAVADFLARLKEVRQRCHSAVVAPVILDGENAWEYYQDNGLPFLSKLYHSLAGTPGLAPATFSEVLEWVPERRVLSHIHPGSWINANYGIWIGHPEENLGWDYLAKARAAAVQQSPAVAALLAGETAPPDPGKLDVGYEVAELVVQALYAAQGSDWFWWYGDDHFSPHSASFDLLFRRHLMNVYRLLGLTVPRELYEPIKKQSPAGFVREPAALITPAISGLVTDYFEWLAAGLYDLTKQYSAIHAGENLLQSFFYGYDRNFFYVRIDGVQFLEKILKRDDVLSLHLIHANEYRLDMQLGLSENQLMVKGPAEWQASGTLAQYGVVRIAEARIPLPVLQLTPGDKIFAYLTLIHSGEEVGRWPVDTPLLLSYTGPDLDLETWLI
ncbi:glycoside hydrolase [Geomonas limicola]|uniref:Glycoside hydrolase n=1 Tax=Geomonas limicola TaxID=2740186 RepID=A0A6V8NCD4_9BACT|nr:glycoside hydrolase family 57 protein [Geomonas limicola]GFO70191.1 glycoside hydrolase [Geomonas limicola]